MILSNSTIGGILKSKTKNWEKNISSGKQKLKLKNDKYNITMTRNIKRCAKRSESVSNLIPEGTIGLFLYCCTLLLISNIYSAHRINLGTCKLSSLQDTNLYLVHNET